MQLLIQQRPVSGSVSPSAASCSFEPQFEGPIEGYVVNFLKKNYWRMAASLEYGDVMQEAKCLFLQLKAHYPRVDSPQWFMSLFKMSLTNLVHDLATKDSMLREIPPLSSVEIGGDDGSFGTMLDSIPGDTENLGMLSIMIRKAPEDVRSVLSLFLNAPQEIVDLAWLAWSRKKGKKGDENDLLCRWLGRPLGTDLVGPVREYFAN